MTTPKSHIKETRSFHSLFLYYTFNIQLPLWYVGLFFVKIKALHFAVSACIISALVVFAEALFSSSDSLATTEKSKTGNSKILLQKNHLKYHLFAPSVYGNKVHSHLNQKFNPRVYGIYI